MHNKTEKDANYLRLINCREWQKVRRRYLKAHPVCERCGREFATVVHHKTPLERLSLTEMKRLAYSEANLMALCVPCHKAIHAELRYNDRARQSANKRMRVERFNERFGENGGLIFQSPYPTLLNTPAAFFNTDFENGGARFRGQNGRDLNKFDNDEARGGDAENRRTTEAI